MYSSENNPQYKYTLTTVYPIIADIYLQHIVEKHSRRYHFPSPVSLQIDVLDIIIANPQINITR